MKKLIILATMLMLSSSVFSQKLPPSFGNEYDGAAFADSRIRTYLTPRRIVWKYDGGGHLLINPEALLTKGHTGQSDLGSGHPCIMKSSENEFPSILLDFGSEIQGGLQLVTTMGSNSDAHIRIRFGESVSEAMSTVGKQGATNDHAMRDFTMVLPWLGVAEVGNSGFRFVRIDLVDPNKEIQLKEVNAIFTYRDIPYLGSFRSNDERLNRIWMTGAYTVHLNMQEYLWDGIKRDRLVWLGDMFAEVRTINNVFGFNEVVPKSLDFVRDLTPLPEWMNGMFTYSLWWIIIQRDCYRYHGNLVYLKEQQSYLSDLLKLLLDKEVDADGNRTHTGGFLDWASTPNEQGVNAGTFALMVMAFDAGAELCTTLGDATLAKRCSDMATKMRKHVPDHNNLKQAAAFLVLADMMPAKKTNDEILNVGGAKDFSAFGSYFIVEAQAKAGDYEDAIENLKQFWGGMLDLGATTFWEGFDLEWMKDAAPIDELVPEGKKDIHADFGAYCYTHLRHSLCHGWASGCTSWLTEHVLGVQVVEPGCKTLRIAPHLGELEWVEGSFPTPMGVVKIKHRKDAKGKVITDVTAPKGVKIIKN